MRFSRSGLNLVVISVTIGALGSSGANGQGVPPAVDSKPRLAVTRITEAIVVDGKLDEPAWAAAEASDAFTQTEPVEGAEPSERTELRVLQDEKNLYIGVRCFDSEPEKILAKEMRRDAGLASDDVVQISIDTFNDRRNGYYFHFSPAGSRGDGLIDDNSRLSMEWDGIWYSKARIDEEGWTVEIRIPFKTIAFDPEADGWGFNVQRVIRRHNEVIRWATPLRNSGIVAVVDAGRIEGLEGMNQGLGLSVTPYLVTDLDFQEGNQTAAPSLDLFYQITPSITAAITFNTDFADTEVDSRRVNLTRFPLFFQEKRDFFLQDAGVFRFGGIRSSPLPFHSRRIGIVNGEERDILAGVKVTGRHNDLRFGFLDVQMKEDDVVGDKNLAVGRMTYDINGETTAGVIATNGDPSRRGQNQLFGFDLFHRETIGENGDVLEGRAWAQGTHSDPTGGASEDDYTFGGRVIFPNEPWNFSLFAAQVGEEFRPALGFVSRPGEREFHANAGYTWRPNGGTEFVRSVSVGTDASAYTDLSGDLTSARSTIASVSVESEAGDEIELQVDWEREELQDPFEIVDGVVIPQGRHDGMGGSFGIETSSSRPVRFDASYGYRDFFTGTRQDYSAGLTWRPSPNLLLSGGYNINDVDLPEGDFIVRIARGRVNIQFSPEIAWSNLVQWDNQSDLLGVNSRLRWEFEPGRDVYVVLNSGFDTDETGFNTTSNDLTVKLGWTFRF